MWTVQVEVQLPDNGPKFESHETWYVHNDVYLVSRDGRRKLVPKYEQDNAGTSKAVLNYHFPNADRGKPEDWFLVCRVPASMIELTIPFEFKDVLLP